MHDVLAKYDGGQIPDLLNYFSEPWARLLYHDEFPQLRSRLIGSFIKGMGASSSSKQALEATVAGRAQDDVMDFIRQQGPAECPGYLVPATARLVVVM